MLKWPTPFVPTVLQPLTGRPGGQNLGSDLRAGRPTPIAGRTGEGSPRRGSGRALRLLPPACSLGWPGPRGGRWCGHEIAVRRPRRSLELAGQSSSSRGAGRDELGAAALVAGAVRAAGARGAATALPPGRRGPHPAVGRVAGATTRWGPAAASALGARVPCGRISAAPAFIRVAWSFRAARMRLSQGLWFGVEGARAFCLPSRSLRTCFYLLKLKSLGIGGGTFRSLSSPPGSQGFWSSVGGQYLKKLRL